MLKGEPVDESEISKLKFNLPQKDILTKKK